MFTLCEETIFDTCAVSQFALNVVDVTGKETSALVEELLPIKGCQVSSGEDNVNEGLGGDPEVFGDATQTRRLSNHHLKIERLPLRTGSISPLTPINKRIKSIHPRTCLYMRIHAHFRQHSPLINLPVPKTLPPMPHPVVPEPSVSRWRHWRLRIVNFHLILCFFG